MVRTKYKNRDNYGNNHHAKSYPHLTYPAGLVSVEASSDISYSVDPFSEKIYTMDADSSTTLHSYKVTYEVPEFSIENLKAVKRMKVKKQILIS